MAAGAAATPSASLLALAIEVFCSLKISSENSNTAQVTVNNNLVTNNLAFINSLKFVL